MNNIRIRVKIGRTHDKKPFYYNSKEMGNLLVFGGFIAEREKVIARLITQILSKYKESDISFIILSPHSSSGMFDNFAKEYNSIKVYKDEKLFHEKMKDLMMIKEANSLFLDDTFIAQYGEIIGAEGIARIKEVRKKNCENYFVIIDDYSWIFGSREWTFDLKRLFINGSKNNINLIVSMSDYLGRKKQNIINILSLVDSKIVFTTDTKDSFIVLGDSSATTLNRNNYEAYYQSKTGEKIKLNLYNKDWMFIFKKMGRKSNG